MIHDVPGSGNTIIVPTPTTTTTITGAILGSTYTIQIQASNTFAYGLVTSTVLGEYIKKNKLVVECPIL